MLTETLSVVTYTPDDIKKSHVLLTINSAININSRKRKGYYFSTIPIPRQSSARFFTPITMRIPTTEFAANVRDYQRNIEAIVSELHLFQERFNVDLNKERLAMPILPISTGYIINKANKTDYATRHSYPVCPYYDDLMQKSPFLSEIVDHNPVKFEDQVFQPDCSETAFFKTNKLEVDDFINRSKHDQFNMLFDRNFNTRDTFAVFLAGRCIYATIPGWVMKQKNLTNSQQELINFLFSEKNQTTNFI